MIESSTHLFLIKEDDSIKKSNKTKDIASVTIKDNYLQEILAMSKEDIKILNGNNSAAKKQLKDSEVAENVYLTTLKEKPSQVDLVKMQRDLIHSMTLSDEADPINTIVQSNIIDNTSSPLRSSSNAYNQVSINPGPPLMNISSSPATKFDSNFKFGGTPSVIPSKQEIILQSPKPKQPKEFTPDYSLPISQVYSQPIVIDDSYGGKSEHVDLPIAIPKIDFQQQQSNITITTNLNQQISLIASNPSPKILNSIPDVSKPNNRPLNHNLLDSAIPTQNFDKSSLSVSTSNLNLPKIQPAAFSPIRKEQIMSQTPKPIIAIANNANYLPPIITYQQTTLPPLSHYINDMNQLSPHSKEVLNDFNSIQQSGTSIAKPKLGGGRIRANTNNSSQRPTNYLLSSSNPLRYSHIDNLSKDPQHYRVDILEPQKTYKMTENIPNLENKVIEDVKRRKPSPKDEKSNVTEKVVKDLHQEENLHVLDDNPKSRHAINKLEYEGHSYIDPTFANRVFQSSNDKHPSNIRNLVDRTEDKDAMIQRLISLSNSPKISDNGEEVNDEEANKMIQRLLRTFDPQKDKQTIAKVNPSVHKELSHLESSSVPRRFLPDISKQRSVIRSVSYGNESQSNNNHGIAAIQRNNTNDSVGDKDLIHFNPDKDGRQETKVKLIGNQVHIRTVANKQSHNVPKPKSNVKPPKLKLSDALIKDANRRVQPKSK